MNVAEAQKINKKQHKSTSMNIKMVKLFILFIECWQSRTRASCSESALANGWPYLVSYILQSHRVRATNNLNLKFQKFIFQ